MTDVFSEMGERVYEALSRELDTYGIPKSDTLQVLRAKSIIPYYDPRDGNIYLPNFDPDDPMGKLQLIFLRSLLSCDSNEEIFEFFQVIMPWLIGHELGHHLRHHHGLMGENLWHEEQVANYFAFAVTKHRLTMQQRIQLRQFFQRALEGLARHAQFESVATVSYDNILHALHVSGQVDQATVLQLEMWRKIFDVDPQMMLVSSQQLPEDVLKQVQQRDAVIESINQEYIANVARYLYYHLGWLHLGISSSERYYVEEFKRLHLSQHTELLSLIDSPSTTPTIQQIQACFRASRELTSLSPTAGRYFYKRYRSLLCARIQSILGDHLKKEALRLMQRWDEHFDALNYLAELVPSEVRQLLPNVIEGSMPGDFMPEEYLPTETDLRLWRRVKHQSEDAAAAHTLRRLQALDSADVYRMLSAEISLQVIQEFYYVHLDEGEVLLRQGELDNDVFILVEGRLGVSQEEEHPRLIEELYDKLIEEPRQPSYVGIITPGQVIGEMAFFTHDPRNANVCALEPSVCFVLKAADLQLLAYSEPMIVMQMASAIAHRLNSMMQE